MNRHASFTIVALVVVRAAFAAEYSATNQDDPTARKLSERIGTFLQARCLHALKDVYRQDRDRQAWKSRYERLTVQEKARYCIYQLRNEAWVETDNTSDHEPYSHDPEGTPTRELVKLGRSAIPQLLEALDCRIPTGMSYSRFTAQKYLVQDAALIAIERIACRRFTDTDPLSIQDPQVRQKCREQVRQWWEKHKDADEVQWAKEILLAEKSAAGESREIAIDSLYRRCGKDSYPTLVSAYWQLAKTDAKADIGWLRPHIVCLLLKNPTAAEKPVFASAMQDSALCICP